MKRLKQPPLEAGHTIIYGLLDPRTRELRYIGKTIQGTTKKRLKNHLSTAHKEHTHKARWIKSLLASGERPICIELVRAPGNDNELERVYIRGFITSGAQLTNLSAGGEGGAPSREVIEKMRRAALADRSARVATLSKYWGLPHSEETRRLISVKARLRPPATEETKRKIGESSKGRRWSEGAKALRAAQARENMTPAQRAGLLLGRGPKSEETRAKMRLSAVRGWAKRKANAKKI